MPDRPAEAMTLEDLQANQRWRWKTVGEIDAEIEALRGNQHALGCRIRETDAAIVRLTRPLASRVFTPKLDYPHDPNVYESEYLSRRELRALCSLFGREIKLGESYELRLPNAQGDELARVRWDAHGPGVEVQLSGSNAETLEALRAEFGIELGKAATIRALTARRRNLMWEAEELEQTLSRLEAAP